MTIAEAAQAVLKDAARPMHVNEIYEQIIQRNLYVFGAKNPKGVMSQAIYARCDLNPKAKQALFKKLSQGTYEMN